MDVQDEHPAPWPEDEPVARPSTFKRRTDERESLKGRNRPLEAFDRIERETVRSDQVPEVLHGRRRHNDGRHRSEVFESCSVAFARLTTPQLGSLERPWDAIE